MTQPLMCLYFLIIQSGEKNIIYRTYYLIPFIAGEVGCEQTGNWEWKKVCYTICKVSQELLNSITTHSILGDSGAINRSQKKRWMTALSHLLFFMADGRLNAKRGLTRAHCLSLSLIRKQQVGSQEQEKDTSPPPLWVMLRSHAHYYWYTHAHRLHTHTHT